MELNLCHFHDYASYTLGFLGQDTDVLKLHAVTQVCALFGHS
jgi:hypothetical protein